jgi:hypothetical protein
MLTLVRGHLSAIFSEVCSKIKDLVGDQLSVIESREGKPAVVSNKRTEPFPSSVATHFFRQLYSWVVLVKTSTLGKNLSAVSAMLKFNNQLRR